MERQVHRRKLRRPLFTNASAWDFSLTAGSPRIDAAIDLVNPDCSGAVSCNPAAGALVTAGRIEETLSKDAPATLSGFSLPS